MGRRKKQAERCDGCRLRVTACICAELPRLETETHLALVMHQRETRKTTATAPLALRCLSNASLHVQGVKDDPLDPRFLIREGRRALLLFPREGATPLAALARDARPIDLIVPDGNWGQARRIAKRVAALEGVECVSIPEGAPSGWGVRTETRPEGLATLEAIAKAFDVLEGKGVGEGLHRALRLFAERTIAARG